MNRLRLGLLRRTERRVINGAHAKAVAAIPGDRPTQGSVPRPAFVNGESLFNRSDASPQPTFTRAAPPAPPTRPIAGLATADAVAAARPRGVRPFVSAGAPKTLLFDELARELPLPPAMSPWEKRTVLRPAPASAEPGCDVELYSAPGWTRAVTALRLERGELDDWPADVERGLGRNAAEEATALRHSRQGVAEGWRRFCLAVGHPEWTDPGLHRIHELVMQDRDGTGPQRAAVGGAA